MGLRLLCCCTWQRLLLLLLLVAACFCVYEDHPLLLAGRGDLQLA
jgi:hypothetical protein